MVQTFFIQDTVDLIYDNDKLSEWKEKIESLDLDGQKLLSNPDKSPIPFEYLNQSQIRMWSTLCPKRIKVKEYKDTPIPIEILGLIELNNREGYFSTLMVWVDDKEPDPILVGSNHGQSIWTSEGYYLMGRWGDELRPYAELKEKAVLRKSEEYQLKISDEIKRVNGLDSKNEALKYFATTISDINSDLPF